LVTIKGGDDRYYDNIFVGNGEKLTSDRKGNLKELRWISSVGLWGYDGREQPLLASGNVYYRGAEPYLREAGSALLAGTDPKLKLVPQADHFILQISPGSGLKQAGTKLVTTGTLGQARTPGLAYEQADGSPLKIDTDYFGKRRSEVSPTAGPFENPDRGTLKLTVW
jgi:alpha-N-arabinofuranosidase